MKTALATQNTGGKASGENRKLDDRSKPVLIVRVRLLVGGFLLKCKLPVLIVRVRLPVGEFLLECKLTLSSLTPGAAHQEKSREEQLR